MKTQAEITEERIETWRGFFYQQDEVVLLRAHCRELAALVDQLREDAK